MKKLFLMAAVVMGMSMVSCGGNAEKAEEAQVEEVAPEAAEVIEGAEVENADGQVEGAEVEGAEVAETPAN